MLREYWIPFMTLVLFALSYGTLAHAARREGAPKLSPHAKLESPGPADVRWTRGFWAERFELCRTVTIPAVRQALQNPANAAVLQNLRVAAGLLKGKHLGRDWGDGDCYKWLEAVAHVYAVTRDEKLDRLMDEWIGAIAKAQAPDGYISTNIQLTRKERFTNTHHHELYNMGHLLTAAAVHHRATGKDSFLAVARNLGDFLYKTFGPRPAKLAHYGWNPSNIMGLVDLYRATADRRYLELAGIFVDMRGSAGGGTDLTQDHVPLRKETQGVGHCVCACYLYSGAADVVAETGDKELLQALERIWRNVTERRMYITGAVGSLPGGRSTRGDPVHEAFGADYQLPSRTAYNETCANIANAMWNRRMLHLTADAKYADVMERVLYNSMLSAISVDGKTFFYTNPLACDGRRAGLARNHTFQRWSIFRCYCCPPQVARTLARLARWVYSVSDEGVWVHLYGGSSLKTRLPGGSAVELLQETAYPWDGRVTITVKAAPARKLSIMLRVPSWSADSSLKVNGRAAAGAVKPGTYVRLDRRWSAGDRVELTLPMPVRLVRAHPKVENLRGKTAVMRGPVVYCLESVDLPEGVPMNQVHLPANIRLTPRHRKDFLGGLTVLEGRALRLLPDDRKDRLNRPVTKGAPVPVRLIPYYAWANRGLAKMAVWLPLR